MRKVFRREIELGARRPPARIPGEHFVDAARQIHERVAARLATQWTNRVAHTEHRIDQQFHAGVAKAQRRVPNRLTGPVWVAGLAWAAWEARGAVLASTGGRR